MIPPRSCDRCMFGMLDECVSYMANIQIEFKIAGDQWQERLSLKNRFFGSLLTISLLKLLTIFAIFLML